MVKLGVYLVARFAPAFADVGIWRPLVVGVGLTTMIAGGLRALRPFDLKQLLAFGTISQLGFLMVMFGIGIPKATVAACALLLAHGLFKAALFMVVGIVDHQLHTRDVRQLPQLGAGWTPTKVVAVVSAASMAAVPPLAGFIAKETAYAALVDGTTGDRLVLAGIVTGSILTVAYSLRFVMALVRPALAGDPLAAPAERPEPVEPGKPPRPAFVAPAILLATATVVFGVAPVAWDGLVNEAAHALDADAHYHLALWHGFNTALVLSLLTLASGAAVFALRRPVARLQRAIAPRTTGLEIYDAIVRRTLNGAGRLTGVVQSGSLPIYIAVILVTAAVAPTLALLSGTWWSGWPRWVGPVGQVPVAALMVGAAVATTIARRRFAAAILLGAVGYGMAVVFVLQGAPDLALTQFGVETLSMVVFLLVLRQLPDRFERQAPAMGQPVRIAVSVAVGVFVMLMALGSSGARTEPPVSEQMVELAYPEGYGRNVVNVILVDIRGIDTLGEITVLVAAAVGITALARSGRTPRPRAANRRELRELVAAQQAEERSR
jgi:multicomponent Na+:H+ antiporter subunit A